MKIVDEILSKTEEITGCMIPNSVFKQLEANRFVIWGTGKAGRYAVEQCGRKGLFPIGVCDSFPHKKGDFLMGVPLYSGKEILHKYPGCTVLVSCDRRYGISKQLDEEGVSYIVWDSTDLFTGNFTYGIEARNELAKNKDAVQNVYEALSDRKSKKIYRNKLEYMITLEPELLSGFFEDKIYFGNDVIPSVNCDAVLDCGAYTGDTLDSFIKNEACVCQHYYAFEPDVDNNRKLQEYVKSNRLKNVEIRNLAVWSDKVTLQFRNDSMPSSRIVQSDGIEIQASRIDDMIPESESVGFIKMDVEGAEIQALWGGKNTIQKYHPMLAVSIYHNKHDMWEVPLLLKKLNPGYRLYIRHHTSFYPDTVCYAI